MPKINILPEDIELFMEGALDIRKQLIAELTFGLKVIPDNLNNLDIEKLQNIVKLNRLISTQFMDRIFDNYMIVLFDQYFQENYNESNGTTAYYHGVFAALAGNM